LSYQLITLLEFWNIVLWYFWKESWCWICPWRCFGYP